LVDDVAHLLMGKPLCITLQLALGRHFHRAEAIAQTELAQQRRLCQLQAQAPVGFLEHRFEHHGAQGKQ
jgi:hypothetical protein